MSTALFLQIVTIAADLIIFAFVGFYLWTLQKDRKKLDIKAKQLSEKEAKIESEYRQIIENAHNKENEILEKASEQANNIITNAQYVSDSSKQVVEKALQKMIADIQNEAAKSSTSYVNNYKNYLNQISENSLNNFQNVAQKFETEMQAQMQEFRNTLLSNLQKELEQYKQQRFKVAEEKVDQIVQEIAQKVFNRSISLEDHKELIIKSLERSKKEGVFD